MKRFQVMKLDNDGNPVHSNNHYLIVNIDEPYAEKVFRLIRNHEMSKGTWNGPLDFDDFVNKLTKDDMFDFSPPFDIDEPEEEISFKPKSNVEKVIEELEKYGFWYELKNESNGHFHCRSQHCSVLFQFWANTGKILGPKNVEDIPSGLNNLINLLQKY